MTPRIALPPAIDPAALATHDPDAPVVALSGETMGTTWHVSFAGPVPAATIRAAVEMRLDRLVAEMSHWDSESHLCRFNRAPAGSWVPLPTDFATVIDVALRVAAASGGAFDPAAGRLVDLWGHGPPGPQPVPNDGAVAAALAVSGWHRLRWDRAGRRLRQPGGLALDLSGIAKGHAADAVADLLADHGIHNTLVEVGGEFAGRGLRPDGDPWWVDLEDPTAIHRPLRVAAHAVGVATSGSYVRGDHTLDPRTGHPVGNGVLAVSVVAPSAMLADALATAIHVLWPDLSPLAALAPAARIIAADGEHLTPSLAAMLG